VVVVVVVAVVVGCWLLFVCLFCLVWFVLVLFCLFVCLFVVFNKINEGRARLNWEVAKEPPY
jgi:hypothetical protein